MAIRGLRPRPWLTAWVLFSILGSLWAIATPIFAVPDEPAHAVYSAAAVRGQVWAPTNGIVTEVRVPAEYAAATTLADCYIFQPTVSASCAGAFPDTPGEETATTTAGRYPPAYYVYAGLGTVIADGADSIYLMRLLTAVAVAALLASATCSALASANRTLALSGMALAATPMLFFFSGSVNPQAPEIAAAVLLWVSGAGLLRHMRRGLTDPMARSDLRRVISAIVVLTLIRPLSLFWLAIIVVSLLVALASWRDIGNLLRDRLVLASIPLVALTTGSTVVWILFRNALGQQDVTLYADLRVIDALRVSVSKLDNEFMQMIGVFGWLDSPAPGVVYILYPIILGVLLAALLQRAAHRTIWVLSLLAIAVVAVPVVLELLNYPVSAFAWQGRYTMPVAVGIPLLAGLLSGRGTDRQRRGHRFIVLGMAAIHLVCFIGALARNVFGIDGFWGLTPTLWAPPVPTWALLTALVGTLGAVVIVTLRASVAADEDRPADSATTVVPDGATASSR